MTTKNPIAGIGIHSMDVPVVPGLVVLIRDGHHAGTSVWRRDEDQGDDYVFVSHDTDRVEYAERCLLVRGLDLDEIPADTPYGCDLESPDGLVLLGTDRDDDLSWIPETAEVIWDSGAMVEIDAASLGDLWQGDVDDLHRFAEILEETAGLRVRAHTSTGNGAVSDYGALEIPEEQWNRALDLLTEEHPNVWA